MKSMILTFVTLTSLFFLVATGCGEKPSLMENPASAISRTVDTTSPGPKVEVIFTAPAGLNLDGISDMHEVLPDGFNILGSLVNSIVFYRAENDEWPTSWEQLKEKYLPIIPVNKISGQPYMFADYDPNSGPVPADTIVAYWSVEGPEIYVADIRAGGFATVKVNKKMFESALAVILDPISRFDRLQSDDEFAKFRLVSIMDGFSTTAMSTYSFEHQSIPLSKEEFLEGFIVNPAFNPGFDISSSEGCNLFKVLVNPASGRAVFSKAEIGPIPSSISAIIYQVVKPGESSNQYAEIDPSGHITIFTDKDLL